MPAYINGKKVNAAYINGKEVKQIYDNGKLVYTKYLKSGSEITFLNESFYTEGAMDKNVIEPYLYNYVVDSASTDRMYGLAVHLNKKILSNLDPTGKVKLAYSFLGRELIFAKEEIPVSYLKNSQAMPYDITYNSPVDYDHFDMDDNYTKFSFSSNAFLFHVNDETYKELIVKSDEAARYGGWSGDESEITFVIIAPYRGNTFSTDYATTATDELKLIVV